ncbi:hypothetical protein [Phascolarctobacterium sp.]|uniref:hypothetical protein n=1 Tax=Phascolarctobacterium sp. TaxID=2049039 RepID=UPI00386428D3
MGINKSFRDGLFFLICFFLLFNNIPLSIQITAFVGPFGSKLVCFPLIIGLIYSLVMHYRYKNVFVSINAFKKFLYFLFGVSFLSLVTGLWVFPYYDLILKGPPEQMGKFLTLLKFSGRYTDYLSDKQLLSFWMIVKPIRGLFLNTIFSFGTAYLIYCWYHDDWKRALNIITKAALCSIGVIFAYCIVEVNYLAGSQWATKVLETINPYIHEVRTDGKWCLLYCGRGSYVRYLQSHLISVCTAHFAFRSFGCKS